jgi:acetylornithine deacetylase/succinyl-diaminopimelate desuccinylase-like protein
MEPVRLGAVRQLDDDAIRSEVTEVLRALVRIDTTNPPGNETPAATFLKSYLEGAGIECELVARDPKRANLVARIKGTGEGPTLMLMGHTDVVPADPQAWTHPPFDAHLDDDGFIWGRGTVDMKNETATRAVTMALLARSEWRPKGDLTFIAQADEENGEHEVGLKWLREERPDIRSDFAIDEGGGLRLHLSDGRVVIPINVGEKATLPVRVTAIGEAGHASTPTAGSNAVPLLAQLVQRLGRHDPPPALLSETRRTLEILVGNFGDDLKGAIQRAVTLHQSFPDELPPLFGTTIAPTILQGSSARNVMPGRASVTCDCRVLPGTGTAELERELTTALGSDIPYELEFLEPPTGGTVAPIDTPLYGVCEQFLAEHEPQATLLPTISSGFTDSHFMREAFGTVAYGFWPCRTTPSDIYLGGIHNKDERIHVDDLVYATRFHLFAAERMGSVST